MGANGFQPISPMRGPVISPPMPPPAFIRHAVAMPPGLRPAVRRVEHLPPVREFAAPARSSFGDFYRGYLAIWTGRLGLAKVVDSLTGREVRDAARQATALHPSEVSPSSIFSHGAHSYAGLLKLNAGRDMTLDMLASPVGYARTVAGNLKPLAAALRPKAVAHNLAEGKPLLGFGLKEYLTHTVGKLNAAPMRTLFDWKAPGFAKVSLQGLGHLFGVGWYANDALKAGRKAYRAEKQEDAGSLKPWLVAGKATAVRAVENAVAWEAAGAGFAIGRAVLPGFKLPKAMPGFGGGYVPAGGYLLGTLLGSVAYRFFTRNDA
ncbi:MAG: hypothetical protein AB7P76_10605 [Candidatus Melainabacteria bacterium]